MIDHVRREISVTDFHRMIDAGVFDEDERIELVDGVLMSYASPQGGGHCGLIWNFFELIRSGLADRAVVRSQSPLVLDEKTRLEPDVMVLRPLFSAYRRRSPTASDVLAVIEVADSSLRFDRVRKQRLYASAAIPEYWIADVQKERLEIYREPAASDYAVKELPERDATVSFAAFPDVTLSIRELFA